MAKEKDIFIEGEHIENLFSDDLNPFLKCGMTWLFFVGMALFSLTWFVRWPDLVKAPAVLTSDIAPTPIISKVPGTLEILSVRNGDPVRKGSLLGIIQSSTDLEEFAQLDSLINHIDSIYQDFLEEVVYINLNYYQFSQLGEIQSTYEQFLRSFRELQFALSDEYLQEKLELLNQRLDNLKRLNTNLRFQRNTRYQDYQLALETFEKEQKLYKQQSTTAYELKQYESQMLSKRLAFQNSRQSIVMNEQQQADIVEQKIQLTQSIHNQKNTFIQAFKNLQAVISQWKNTYLLTSPIEGTVTFAPSLQVNTNLNPQNPTFYVVAPSAQTVAHIKLAQRNLNKIDLTKLVKLKLQAYPFEDFGVLEGRIKSVSNIPQEGLYEAVIVFPQGLLTSFHKELEMRIGLEGEAEIVLDNERLISKLMKKFKR